MSLDFGVNWLAVIVATVIWFVIGAVWYAPQYPPGRMWLASGGYKPLAPGQRPGIIFIVVPAITYLITTIAVAMIAKATGSDSIGDAIVLWIVVAGGIYAMSILTIGAFESNKPARWTWAGVNIAYNLIGLLIVCVIVSLIR